MWMLFAFMCRDVNGDLALSLPNNSCLEEIKFFCLTVTTQVGSKRGEIKCGLEYESGSHGTINHS